MLGIFSVLSNVRHGARYCENVLSRVGNHRPLVEKQLFVSFKEKTGTLYGKDDPCIKIISIFPKGGWVDIQTCWWVSLFYNVSGCISHCNVVNIEIPGSNSE